MNSSCNDVIKISLVTPSATSDLLDALITALTLALPLSILKFKALIFSNPPASPALSVKLSNDKLGLSISFFIIKLNLPSASFNKSNGIISLGTNELA